MTPAVTGPAAGGATTRAATLRLRRGTPADAARAGNICFEDFASVAAIHGYAPDIPDIASAETLAADLLGRDDVYAVVATLDGEVVGSNFLWEFGSIAAAGPLTVDPSLREGGVGRRLMEDILDRARAREIAGVRIVQAGYHMRSLALYLKLGFEVCEPLAVLQGPTPQTAVAGHAVRAGRVGDLAACNALCRRVHGHERRDEVLRAVARKTLKVVEHAGRISGYATSIGYFGHAVAESNDDLAALIGAAEGIDGPGFLAPVRNTGLLRWCMDHGLRLVQPMNLMSQGLYKSPAGVFMPSVLF